MRYKVLFVPSPPMKVQGVFMLCGRQSRFYSKDLHSSSDRAYLGLSLGSLEKVRLINVKKLKRLMLNCKL